MNKNQDQPADAAELRRQAEARLQAREQTPLPGTAGQSEARLVHELQVHQIELEMQNEELRRTQAEIEAGRTRYFDLYDQAPVGYCTLSEPGLILEANLTLTTLLGLARGALIKQPLSRFILKDDQNLFYLHRKRLFETGAPQICEMRLVKPDGAPFWAHLTATAAQAEDGAPLCRVALSDITARKRAEAARESNYALLQIAGETARFGGWSVDLEKNLCTWSDAVADIHEVPRGYAPPLQEGINFYAPEWREPITRVFSACAEKGIPYNEEMEIITAKGKRVWVRTCGRAVKDDHGAILKVQGAFQDITARKQTEINLKEREGLLQKIFDILPIGLWFADKHGKLLRGNPAGVKIWGAEPRVDPAQYGVFKARRLPSGEEIAPDDWALAHSIREGTTTLDELLEIDAFDGRKKIILNFTAPVLDDNGAVQGAVIVNQDITARQREGEALKRIEWLLTSRPKASDEDVQSYMPPYGDLVELNTCRLILDSVGEQTLADIVRDYLRLLDTSSAVYEKNGDYALGIFSSGWCRTLDAASRRVCGTDDNRTALNCGQWHCHESCWSRASKTAIETGQPTDIECDGGIRLYAVPIRVGDEIIGAINIGYGDPPRDEEKLRELASRYQVSYEELRALSISYESRPAFITDLAKDRLQASARLIGVITARKQAEEALLKANEHLAYAQSAARAGVWDWDMATGELAWSPEMFSLFEFDPNTSSASFALWRSAVHPEDREKAEARINQAVLDHRPLENEYRIVTSSGRVKWIGAQGNTSYGADGTPLRMSGICLDITARQQAEEALRESEERYRLLTDNAVSGIAVHELVLDAAGQPVDFRYLSVNPVFERLTGLKAKDVLGLRATEVLPGIEKTPLIKTYGQVALSGVAIQFEQYYEPLMRHYSINAYRVGENRFATSFSDITERKRAQEDLQRKQAMLEQTEALAHVGSWEWEVATDTVIWSDELFRIFRRDPDQGAPSFAEHSSLYPPEDFRRLNEAVEAALRNGTPYEIELHALCMDGATRTCLAHGQAEKRDGRVVRLSGSIQDITERKQAEEKEAASQALLRLVLDRVPAYICAKNLAGRFLLVNQKLADFYGRPIAAMTGSLHADLCEDKEELRAMLAADRAVIESGQIQCIPEETMKNPDGSTMVLETYKIPFTAHNEPAVLVTSTDITERKRADAKLNEQLDELRRWQAVTLGREDRVQELKREVNEACRRLGEPARYTPQETGAAES